MPDIFTSSTTTGYGSRVVNSFKGIVFGFILIIVAFGLLYWNEGRKDVSLLARQSKVISAEQITNDPAVQGQLVSITGAFTSQGQISDNLFLKPGDFVSVNRKAEMYAWVETKHTKSSSNSGGSQTDTTTYTYDKQWVEHPKSSSNFTHPEGHENPTQIISSAETRAANATVGKYSVGDINSVVLPVGQPVSLSVSNTNLNEKALLASQDYIFVPSDASTGSLASPQLGDSRISYTTVNSGISTTIMGKLDGSSVSSYFDQNNTKLYRVFSGTRDGAISQLHSEYQTLTWILRAVGFALMLFGFMMVASPIATILDIIPFVGGISSGVIFLVSFLLSVTLTIVTILVSMLLHSLIALIVAIVLVIGVTIFWFKSRKSKGVQPAV